MDVLVDLLPEDDERAFVWRGRRDVRLVGDDEVRFPLLQLRIPGDTPLPLLREYIGAAWRVDPSCVTFSVDNESKFHEGSAQLLLADAPVHQGWGVIVSARLQAARWDERALAQRDLVRDAEGVDRLHYCAATARCWGCQAFMGNASTCLELLCGHKHCCRCADVVDAASDKGTVNACCYCLFCQFATPRPTGKSLPRGSRAVAEALATLRCNIRNCHNAAMHACSCETSLCDEHITHHTAHHQQHIACPLAVETSAMDAAEMCYHEYLHVQGRRRYYCTAYHETLCPHCAVDGKHATCAPGKHMRLNAAAAVDDRVALLKASTRTSLLRTAVDAMTIDASFAVNGEFTPRWTSDVTAAMLNVQRTAVALSNTTSFSGSSVERLRLLHRIGADLKQADAGGNTLIHAAAARGDVPAVAFLLEIGACVWTRNKTNGWTPLHAASAHGRAAVVTALCKRGAPVDEVDDDGWTPAQLAARLGHVDVVKALHRAGANVRRANVHGWIPLFAAAFNGRLEVVKYLAFLPRVNLNAVAVDGLTALNAAAQNGHLLVVQHLHEKGASIHVVDKDGRCPFFAAAAIGNVELARYLLAAGASINRGDLQRSTPLIAAAAAGHVEMVQFLLDAGANVRKVAKDGSTALHVAALYGYVPIVELLIAARADIDARTIQGWTPLHAAAAEGQIVAAQRLHAAGAKIGVVDRNGRSPLHIAAASGFQVVVEFLHSVKADIHAVDKSGVSPLNAAASCGHESIVIGVF